MVLLIGFFLEKAPYSEEGTFDDGLRIKSFWVGDEEGMIVLWLRHPDVCGKIKVQRIIKKMH